jgi:uncharacterized membrane protein YgcG
MLGEASAKVSALAGFLALVLLVSLFLPWAQIVCVLEPCPYPSGWEILRVLDIVLACLAVASIVLAVVSVMRPVPRSALALIVVGAVATFLVLLAPAVEDPAIRPVDYGGSWFLGLIGAFGVLAGGVASYFIRTGFGEDEDGDGEGGEGEEGTESNGGEDGGGGSTEEPDEGDGEGTEEGAAEEGAGQGQDEAEGNGGSESAEEESGRS